MQYDEYLKNSFNQWQGYAQAYTDLALDAAQQSVKQSLALRERIGQLTAENLKQALSLGAQEQELLLQAAEAGQAQAQSASKRIAKLFNMPSTN